MVLASELGMGIGCFLNFTILQLEGWLTWTCDLEMKGGGLIGQTWCNLQGIDLWRCTL